MATSYASQSLPLQGLHFGGSTFRTVAKTEMSLLTTTPGTTPNTVLGAFPATVKAASTRDPSFQQTVVIQQLANGRDDKDDK